MFRSLRRYGEEVIHVDDSVDPVRDLETIQHELCAKVELRPANTPTTSTIKKSC